MAVDPGSATEPEPRRTSPPRAEARTAASPIEVGSDSDDPRPLIVAKADAKPKSLTKGVSALDTLVDLAVTQPRSTVHQVVVLWHFFLDVPPHHSSGPSSYHLMARLNSAPPLQTSRVRNASRWRDGGPLRCAG